jgi:hypothetical protein
MPPNAIYEIQAELCRTMSNAIRLEAEEAPSRSKLMQGFFNEHSG